MVALLGTVFGAVDAAEDARRIRRVRRLVKHRAIVQLQRLIASEHQRAGHPDRELQCLGFGKRIGKLARGATLRTQSLFQRLFIYSR